MRIVLALSALLLTASGCLGSSAEPATRSVHPHPHTRPAAVMSVRGTYATCPSGTFGDELCRDRFTLRCPSPKAAALQWGEPPWAPGLCAAILDYHSAIRLIGGPECNCPASPVDVDVRGRVAGRTFREHVTACTCGASPRAIADARVILRTHPSVG
jgi:hypothetical protein